MHNIRFARYQIVHKVTRLFERKPNVKTHKPDTLEMY